MTKKTPARRLPRGADFTIKTLEEQKILSIAPLTGRYYKDGNALASWMSEYALIRARVYVENEYLLALSEAGFIKKLSAKEIRAIQKINKDFSLADGLRVKELERKYDHDVVAMITGLKESYKKLGLEHLIKYIHAGPTSEDIDNIAWRLLVIEARNRVILPAMKLVVKDMVKLAEKTENHAVIARTHGQVAAADTFGRKVLVFVPRLIEHINELENQQLTGKFNGIVGTWSGFRAAFPETDIKGWIDFSDKFVESFGLKPLRSTSQSNPNDDLAELLQIIKRFDNKLLGFVEDLWIYIKDGYLKKKSTDKISGSSTSPTKSNPWRFEHSTAMLRQARDFAIVHTNNLVSYRLERQLIDKTLIRFLGEIFGFNTNAWRYTSDGLRLLKPDAPLMKATVYADVSYLSESLQLILRREGEPDAYKIVREVTRGLELNQKNWKKVVERLIKSLDVKSPALLRELKSLSPEQSIKDARKITQMGLKKAKKEISKY